MINFGGSSVPKDVIVGSTRETKVKGARIVIQEV